MEIHGIIRRLGIKGSICNLRVVMFQSQFIERKVFHVSTFNIDNRTVNVMNCD